MARIEKWDEVHGTQAPDERMMAFLDSTTDQYAILQLRRSEDTVYERFFVYARTGTDGAGTGY